MQSVMDAINYAVRNVCHLCYTLQKAVCLPP